MLLFVVHIITYPEYVYVVKWRLWVNSVITRNGVSSKYWTCYKLRPCCVSRWVDGYKGIMINIIITLV